VKSKSLTLSIKINASDAVHVSMLVNLKRL